LAKTEADERLNRALTAFLRQEVQAPASAVTDFLDMIIEDSPEGLLADLNRMRTASVQLNAFVKSLIWDSASDRRADETLEAFQRRLRHDLRTPLNAIKGYSELLIEDLEADAGQSLRADLTKLEFYVLQYLYEREGRVVGRAALLRDVWGYDWSGGSNVVEVVISALRRKLGDSAGSLQTVRGAGYRFTAPP